MADGTLKYGQHDERRFTPTAGNPLVDTAAVAAYQQLKAFLRGRAIDADDLGILALFPEDEELTEGQIAQSSHVSRPTVSRHVVGLLGLGLLAERLLDADARTLLLRLTSHGENVLFEVRNELGMLAFAQANAVWLALHKARGVSSELLDRPLSPTSITVLTTVACAMGTPLATGDIVRNLGATQSNVSMALRTLRAQGLVEVRKDPGDGRVHRWVVAERGLKVAQACANAISQ
jgi:DNA-binding MarR family transcriptional regulator